METPGTLHGVFTVAFHRHGDHEEVLDPANAEMGSAFADRRSGSLNLSTA